MLFRKKNTANSLAQPAKQGKRSNGIALKDLSLSVEKSSNPSLFAAIIQFIIVMLGSLGAMYTFITFFNIVHYQPLLITCGVIFSLLFTLLYSARQYVKFTLPFMTLLFIVVIIVFHQDLALGFDLVKNVIVSGINVAMGYSFPVEAFPYALSYATSISIFLLLAMFFLTALIGFAVVYRPNVFIVLLVTFPLFEIGMFFGIVPSYWPLAMLISCWTAVLAMQLSQSKFLWRNSKTQFETDGKKHVYAKSETKKGMVIGSGVTMAVATLAVFGLVSFLLTQIEFTRPPEVDILRADIKTRVDDLFYKDNDMDDTMGGINEGRLERVENRIVKDQVHLQVELPYSTSGAYLKGYVGVNYTGSNWESLTDSQRNQYSNMLNSLAQQGLSPQRFDGLLLDSARNSNDSLQNAFGMASITNILAKRNYTYLPYTASLPGGSDVEYIDDTMTVFTGEGSYSVGYYGSYSSVKDEIASSPLRENDQFKQAEEAYTEYVNDVYTQLPSEGLEGVKQMYENLEYSSIQELGRNIRQYLASSTVYSTTSTRVPRGTDFVDFFLNTTKQGFCTHYATAATVMFRAAGVPARYVEGYIVFPSDYNNSDSVQNDDLSEVGGEGTQASYVMNITDRNAHAWVEYYEEGVGWVPYEVTPGFYSESVNYVSPEPQPLPEPEDPVGEDENKDPELTEEELDEMRRQAAITMAVKIGLGILAFVVFLGLVWLGICLRRNHANHKRLMSFATQDYRQNVVNAYQYLVKLLRFAQADNKLNHPYMQYSDELAEYFSFVERDEVNAAMAVYLKASFSRQPISQEEMERAVEFSKRFAMKYYATLKRSQRFVFLYLKNLY